MTPYTLLPVQYHNTPDDVLTANNTVFVGEGTKWQNPFQVGVRYEDMALLSTLALSSFEFRAWAGNGGFTPANAAEALLMYRRYVTVHPFLYLGEPAGKNIACTCAIGQPCHRDILLELANKYFFCDGC